MNTSILDDLLKVNAINEKNIEIFSKSTRDNKNILVKRDSKSSVIFIDDFYIGDDEYIDGFYKHDADTFFYNSEDASDSERRFEQFKRFIVNKDICDFGFGKGTFLKMSKNYAKTLSGIEFQKNYLIEAENFGVSCYENIDSAEDSFDTVFLFHVLEHLPHPLDTLEKIHKSMRTNGKLIIEVPHANDYLFFNESFKDFTLWSQHLILHTRESLKLFLNHAGFNNIEIAGYQRFGLANHLDWFSKNKPGGHNSNFSIFEDEMLKQSYSNALSRIDKNDTLIAIASK